MASPLIDAHETAAIAPGLVTPSERAWREGQAHRLAQCRVGLLAGIGGMLVLAPWESWSSHWFWYICMIVAAVSALAIPWFGGQLNWGAFRRPWCWGLAVFVTAVFISWLLSVNPHQSWRYLRKEFLFYAVAFVGIILGAESTRDLRILVHALAISGLVACAMGIAVYYFYLYGADDVTRHTWIHEKFVDHDIPQDPSSLRAQYPLEHHNKLGFFAALMTLLVIHVSTTGVRRPWLWRSAAIIPLWALMLTLNRGGLIGLVLAAAIVALLANWRRALVFGAVALVAAILAMPAHVREWYMTIFQEETYTDQLSSMTYRFNGWRGALNMIADHPVFGVGYSWRNFEDLYPQYAVPEEVQRKPHAHNNFLEYAVEIGVPGALGFVVFQIGLLIASVRLWFRRRRRDGPLATLIALQLVILIVGQISYYFRAQLGVVIWSILAISLAAVALESRAEESGPEAPA
jgi:hypothetical protein